MDTAYPSSRLRVSCRARREVASRHQRAAVRRADVLRLPADRGRRRPDGGCGSASRTSTASTTWLLFNAMARPPREVDETALGASSIRVSSDDASAHRADPSRPRPRRREWDSPTLRSGFRRRSSRLRTVEPRRAKIRYRKAQIAAVEWAVVEEEGESWFGFFRHERGTRDARSGAADPLPAHRRHPGVAVNERTIGCSMRRRLVPSLGSRPGRRRCAEGFALVESLVEFNGAQRRANQRACANWHALRRRSEAHLLAPDSRDLRRYEVKTYELGPAPAPVPSASLDKALRGAALLAQQNDARASRR